MRRRGWLIALLLMLVAATGCNLASRVQPTLTALPWPTAALESRWRKIEKGLEWRKLFPHGDELSQIVVVRINPAHFRFRAIYSAGDPKSLAEWRELEPAANVVINANFFDESYQALGAVISDGVRSGRAYLSRGGTFSVRDGTPSVVGYRAGPPQLDETVEQAVQGFPLLMYESEQAFFGQNNGEANRRTAIAEDVKGNILILVSPFLGLSLSELSAYLPATDLDIVTAVNLDGGRSTMIALPAANYIQPSFDAVPSVLAAFAR